MIDVHRANRHVRKLRERAQQAGESAPPLTPATSPVTFRRKMLAEDGVELGRAEFHAGPLMRLSWRDVDTATVAENAEIAQARLPGVEQSRDGLIGKLRQVLDHALFHGLRHRLRIAVGGRRAAPSAPRRPGPAS